MTIATELKKIQERVPSSDYMDEIFYKYLDNEYEKRGGSAVIKEIKEHIFDKDNKSENVDLAIEWCYTKIDVSIEQQVLRIFCRALKEDHISMASKEIAIFGIESIRLDLLDKIYENETDPELLFFISKCVIHSNLSGMVKDKQILTAWNLLRYVYLKDMPKGTCSISNAKEETKNAINELGVHKTANLLHYMYNHRLTAQKQKDIILYMIANYSSPELISVFCDGIFENKTKIQEKYFKKKEVCIC